MIDRSQVRNFDYLLMAAVLALCSIGIAMVYSATITTIDLADYWERQFFFMVVGLAILLAVAFFDYRHLELLAQPAYLGLLLSLIAVYLFGAVQGGSQSWISIGGTLVQPTEAGKFLLIIFFAWYLSRFQDQMGRFGYLIVALLFLGIPLILIYTQPDLGMAVNFAFIGGILILVSGVRLWHLGLLGLGSLSGVPFFVGTLQDYMWERIQMFIEPEANRDASFNVLQALISIGNGGWMGMGWSHGSQNQLHFLRVRHTDFIFSVIAEELGFVGAVLILFLLFFVIWRLVRIADLAQDQFGRLLTMGVASIIFFQTFINVGMNMGLTPVTGVTLPFLSYGGSSLISMLLAIGLAQSVVMRHRKMDFQ